LKEGISHLLNKWKQLRPNTKRKRTWGFIWAVRT
jgi:hypothetical protein